MAVTAKEQLLQARELGHELSTIRRDFSDGSPSKIRLCCTCGYESTWRRSEKAIAGTVIWHIGKALGESDAEKEKARRNGRVLPEETAPSRHA